MTILEQHIEVQQALQKIDSARFSSVQPEEIDWKLNKAEERFIKNRVKQDPSNPGGYQVDIKSAMDLSTITVTNEKRTASIDTDNKFAFIDFSPSLWFPISLKAYVKSCSTFSTTSNTKYVYEINFPNSTNVNAPYYTNYSMTFPVFGTSIFNITTTGYNSIEEKFNFIHYIIQKSFGNISGIDDIYYEKFRNIYSKGKFLMVLPATATYPFSITVDSVTDNTPLSPGYIINDISYTSDSTEVRTPVRIVQQKIVDELQQYPTYKTNKKSPIATLSDSSVQVYFNESFIISSIGIDYIRRPTPVSLTLNRNSELPEHTHREICDLAVEMFSLDLEKPDYQLRVQDRQMSE